MTSNTTKTKYQATIGIECHVQFNTKTKLFSAVDNDAREAPPNSKVSHIDFGLPGALPYLNAEAVTLAIKAAHALGTRPAAFSKFDRKHYFYPDLPKGYQISQYDQPIIVGGEVTISLDDGHTKTVRIHHAHLEEDAGKSTHPDGAAYSLVDLNRAGTPLLEIVSEPDMHSAAEAKAYARELYLLMKYAGVSDADLYHGNIRFDVNVSISDTDALGTRTETKNLNSFRSVEKAVANEIDRQRAVLESGGTVVQETRGWDDAALKTFSQRSKEEAHDYRYFPEPDLPPVVINEKTAALIAEQMPVMPAELRRQFAQAGIDAIEQLIDVPDLAGFVSGLLDAHGPQTAKAIANWLTGPVTKLVADAATDWTTVISRQGQLVKLVAMVSSQLLSSSAAKAVLEEVLRSGNDPETVAANRNLLQESDESALVMLVEKVLSEQPKAADDIRGGEQKAIGFLVGQVMKLSGGKANPQVVAAIIKRQLGV